MKQPCCNYFNKIKHHFKWLSTEDENDNKVFIMPHLMCDKNIERVRIQKCPSCGENIREMQLTFNDQDHEKTSKNNRTISK